MKKILPAFFVLLISLVPVFADEDSSGIFAEIDTSRGTMEFILDFQNMPLAVSAFICLAEGLLDTEADNSQRYYQNIGIKLAVPDFAVQINVPEKLDAPTIPRETSFTYSADNFGTLCLSGYTTEADTGVLIITNGINAGLDKTLTPIGKLTKGDSVLSRLKFGDKINDITIIKNGSEYSNIQINQSYYQTLLKEKRDAELNLLSESNAELAKGIKNFLGLDYHKSKDDIYYYYKVVNEGEGDSPRVGDTVKTHYTGYFLDETVFDSSRNKIQPFEFILGENPVIPGWEQAIMSMKKGEIKKIVLPPELGYGDNGFGPIPAGAWLMYEVEIVEIIP